MALLTSNSDPPKHTTTLSRRAASERRPASNESPAIDTSCEKTLGRPPRHQGLACLCVCMCECVCGGGWGGGSAVGGLARRRGEALSSKGAKGTPHNPRPFPPGRPVALPLLSPCHPTATMLRLAASRLRVVAPSPLARMPRALGAASVRVDMELYSTKVIYTQTDEAPALATYSLLPIIKRFTDPAGIEVNTSDISVVSSCVFRTAL